MATSVSYSKKPTNHVLHLLLTVFTFGAWAPVWIFLILTPNRRSKTVTVGPGPATAVAPATPAGWYPDPYGTETQRYWDGHAWTTSTLDGQPQRLT